MLKTIGKIVYITFAAILAVLFGVLNYNTSSDEAYVEVVSKAAKDEDTEKLVYAFSSFSLPYDATPYVTKSNANGDKLYIYGTMNQINMNYYSDAEATEAKETFKRIEFVYYVFLRSPQFTFTNNTQNGVISNKTGIRFYNADGVYFDYHFVVSDTINSDEYVAHPLTKEDAMMKSKRTYTTTYMNERFKYNFMLIPVTESMVEYIKTNKLNNKDITKINYLDSTGNLVYAEDVNANLNYSQDFFVSIKDYRDAFRAYYDSNTETEEGKTAKENATKYINEFKLSNLGNPSYKEGLKKDEVYNAGLVWKTIGLVFVFVLAFAIVYILMFHFALIKRIVFRRSYNQKTARYVPNKVSRKDMYKPKNVRDKESIKAEVKEVKAESETVETTEEKTDNE